MKVRFGIGVGRDAGEPATLVEVGQAIGQFGFDSIWLSEILSGDVPDPVVSLAYLAGRLPGLTLGTTMLFPGKNVARLAKALATLDRCSGGKLLVTFVSGLVAGPERAAVGVAPAERGAVIDEGLPLLRRLLAGERVTYTTPAGVVEEIAAGPRAIQEPLEFWLGGMGRAALERCGRLGDGWLPSLCTVDEALVGRAVIEDAAAAAGRAIDPEHFGVSLTYARDAIEPAALATIARRARGHDPATLVPVGRDALRSTIAAFVAAGFSKFVLRPHHIAATWAVELEQLAGDIAEL
jgi:probable F420-dependent oxidoreductase